MVSIHALITPSFSQITCVLAIPSRAHSFAYAVTLIDLPQQCATACSNSILAPFANRFSAAEVDWLKPDCVPVVEHKADVIWMSQFLDCFSPEEAVSILQRCKPLLSERGRFAVLECLVDGQKFPAAGFSLAAVKLRGTTH